MENSISKLSLIVEKILDIIFEIPLISESGKKDITKFLDNLCKWCIKTLNGIILNLVKENSNELKELLFEEQRKVKIAHTVDGTLSNEKTIDQYRIESEQDLKPSITTTGSYSGNGSSLNATSYAYIEVMSANLSIANTHKHYLLFLRKRYLEQH